MRRRIGRCATSENRNDRRVRAWIPACAGMTWRSDDLTRLRHRRAVPGRQRAGRSARQQGRHRLPVARERLGAGPVAARLSPLESAGRRAADGWRRTGGSRPLPPHAGGEPSRRAGAAGGAAGRGARPAHPPREDPRHPGGQGATHGHQGRARADQGRAPARCVWTEGRSQGSFPFRGKEGAAKRRKGRGARAARTRLRSPFRAP